MLIDRVIKMLRNLKIEYGIVFNKLIVAHDHVCICLYFQYI
jgi:hypothetical protein